MRNIYRGASITVAASRAETSSEGFLQVRAHRKPVLVPVRSDGNKDFRLLLSPMPKYARKWVRHVDPIFVRGWTFQELRLSTRVLTFGRDDTEFFCLESNYRDGGYPPAPKKCPSPHCLEKGHVDGGDIGAVNRPRSLNGLRPGSVDIHDHKHPFSWSILLRVYTGRKLPITTDRLPTLGALAEEYKLKHALTHYYAGLWREDFLW